MAERIAEKHTHAPAVAPLRGMTRWLHKFWVRTVKAFRVSLSPRTKLEVQLVNAQLKMVRAATWPFAFILPPVSLLVAWATSPWVAWPTLVAWCATITAGCLLFETLYRRIERTTGDDAKGVGRRAKAFTLMGVILAAIWASMGVVMWAPGQIVNHMLLILILASSLSGWSAIGSVHLASGRLPLVCYATVMISSPLFANDTLDHALAGLCMAFALVISMQASTSYETARRMLSLQFQRSGLIGHLRRTKGESDEARRRAESASLAKSQFLANMSHELRTPMNAILGFSEIISTKALGSAIDKYAEYAALIHDSGKHLLSLINDILDLAKIEAGRMELLEEDVDLAALALDATRMMAPKAEGAHLMLTAEIDSDLPLVRADERALRQMIMNLLSNAVKFTPVGGRVTIFASGDEDGISFGVEDNGIGIEEDDLARVFESFGHGRHDITTYEKGTGLGLPIVKGLAKAHGGSVTLTSQRNQGTRVTIYLSAQRVVERPKVQLISTGMPSVMRGGGWGA